MLPLETKFEWEHISDDTRVAVSPIQSNDGAKYYRITIDYPNKRFPERIKLYWFAEFNDAFSSWTPLGQFRREIMPSWRAIDTHSRSAAGAPVYSMMAKNGENRYTFSLADAACPIRLTGGMEEGNGKIKCTVEFFTNRVDMMDHYETILRIDDSNQPWYDALYDVRQWWISLGYTPAHVPYDAKNTMFSSWYNFQKNINEENILEHCKLAKAMGMDTVILDDGWQCDETTNGYTYCGDWEAVPSKFPDMRRFMNRLHEIGMKCILWYSVPFVGIYAKNYERFKNRFLRAKDGSRTVMILDPRFADVRQWLVETYVNAVRDWDLDGLKLDFIDSFSLAEESSTDYDAMDCPSVEAAVAKLLDEIMAALKPIKPEILIEFRQSYIGPVMQKSGNILRVGDCAGAALVNRVSSIDLRLLAGDTTRHETTAVHSDMLLWDYDASVEGAADQLAACLFCTPQISVMLDRLSAEHTKMLKHYMHFIAKHRNILQEGKLIPLHPEANYSQVLATRDDCVIAGLYSDSLLAIPRNTNTCIAVNATGNTQVYVENTESDTQKKCTIQNCMGDVLSCNTITLKSGVTKFEVPHNGFLYLE